MVLYPVLIFNDKRIQIAGAAISGVIIAALTVLCLLNPPVYSTEIMSNGEEHAFDDTYKVYLEDGKYGDVEIRYVESIEDYMVHADFKKAGNTKLTLEAPTGEKTDYDISIEKDRYEITKK